MHHLRSKSSIQRFRLAALLFFTKFILGAASGVMLIYSVAIHDDGLTIIALELAALTILTTLLQWLIATRTHCPLCMTPVLARKGCAKHRHARVVLGSHRLPVAFSLLFKNCFYCPYCHEPTAMKVREKKHSQPDSNG